MAHRLAAAWAGGAAATTEHPCLPLLTKHLVKTPGFVSVRSLTHCVNGFSRVLTFQTSTVFYVPRVGGWHSFLPLVPTFTYRADRGMSGVFHSLPPWRGRAGLGEIRAIEMMPAFAHTLSLPRRGGGHTVEPSAQDWCRTVLGEGTDGAGRRTKRHDGLLHLPGEGKMGCQKLLVKPVPLWHHSPTTDTPVRGEER
jgi:hypothetical protein